MAPHEEFLQLCAAATAGELTCDEQTTLRAHLEGCVECRQVMQENDAEMAKHGQRFGYRPSAIHWRELWMSLTAVVLLALALALAAYRTGVKRGTEAARATADPSYESASLEVQVSDLGHERAQLLTKLGDKERTISDLKQRLSGQEAAIAALKAKPSAGRQPANRQEITQPSSEVALQRDQELAAAQA